MPSSLSPLAYPRYYTDLINAFPGAQNTIDLAFDEKRDAINIRQNFYAFLRALNHHATQLRHDGRLDESKEYTDLYKLGHTRALSIHLDLDTDKWILSFTDRDSTPLIQQMISQFPARERPTASGQPTTTNGQSEAPVPIPTTFHREPSDGFNIADLLTANGKKTDKDT